MNDSSSLSYRQIRVGPVTIGMLGLDELLILCAARLDAVPVRVSASRAPFHFHPIRFWRC